MLFFLLDYLFWEFWSLGVWCVQYLGPVILLVQLIRLIRADADLSLLTYEKLGKTPASLRGQVVWVTGASSGIGEHLVYQLAKAGCKIVLSARREEELNRVKQTCLELPGKYCEEDFLVLPFDILAENKHDKMVQNVIKNFGKIDILVNNAARAQNALIRDTSVELDREMMDLLVFAQISLTKSVLPHFIEQQSGHVVVTSSLAGKIGTTFAATYCLGKFAIQGYFEAMRMEHASDNIDVTLICPGPVKSNVVQNVFKTENEDRLPVGPPSWTLMETSRCAELMAIAMANKMGEVWISPQPLLIAAYLAQYMPDFFRWINKSRARKQIKSYLKSPATESKRED